MNLVKCSKGHFYDGDKHSTCPHCTQENTGDDMPTVAISVETGSNIEKAVMESSNEASQVQTPVMSIKDAVALNETISAGESVDFDDDDDVKTVRLNLESETGKSPVVGWLVGMNGEVYGESFQLKEGKNFIGRGNAMDIILKGDNSISRDKHAIIVYEPHAKMFIAQPGESRELYYINDEVVLNNIQLKQNDKINIGETTLLFVPLCGPNFDWNKKE